MYSSIPSHPSHPFFQAPNGEAFTVGQARSIITFAKSDYSSIRKELTEPREWFTEGTVTAIMAMLAVESKLNVAVADPHLMYLLENPERMYNAKDIRIMREGTEAEQAALLHDMIDQWVFRTHPEEALPDVIAIPINVHNSHWTLTIYKRSTGIGYYFDTLGWKPEWSTIYHLKTILKQMDPDASATPTIRQVRKELFDQQVDGHNCGPHVCSIFGQVLKNLEGTDWRVPNFNIGTEREKMLRRLIDINTCSGMLDPDYTPDSSSASSSAKCPTTPLTPYIIKPTIPPAADVDTTSTTTTATTTTTSVSESILPPTSPTTTESTPKATPTTTREDTTLQVTAAPTAAPRTSPRQATTAAPATTPAKGSDTQASPASILTTPPQSTSDTMENNKPFIRATNPPETQNGGEGNDNNNKEE